MLGPQESIKRPNEGQHSYLKCQNASRSQAVLRVNSKAIDPSKHICIAEINEEVQEALADEAEEASRAAEAHPCQMKMLIRSVSRSFKMQDISSQDMNFMRLSCMACGMKAVTICCMLACLLGVIVTLKV